MGRGSGYDVGGGGGSTGDRWSTTFGKWVHDYGVRRLARDLRVTDNAVRQWVRPGAGGTTPRPEKAVRIVELADGEVGFSEIFGHRAELTRRR